MQRKMNRVQPDWLSPARLPRVGPGYWAVPRGLAKVPFRLPAACGAKRASEGLITFFRLLSSHTGRRVLWRRGDEVITKPYPRASLRVDLLMVVSRRSELRRYRFVGPICPNLIFAAERGHRA
jgi:hypothetical protein